MGRFFTSTQIYNPKQLDRDGFKAYFCERMKKEGYEICDVDCAELSYVLVFADNRKWVTLSSEAYEQGNRTSQADTVRIAKMLGTYCVNTIVIDSDCAMLDLYDNKGKKADTAVMGRADDYLGDDIPEPVKAVWEQFLLADSTWEQFMSVVQGDYVFVEDGLAELAPVIGMDSDNILFEYEDADENNENICYLSFRRVSFKKEKKLTLNAAFKQVFGEVLEPLGYVKINCRYPFYVKLINDDFIEIIGMDNNSNDSHFSINVGIATLYRPEITLHEGFRLNDYWLMILSVFEKMLNDSVILNRNIDFFKYNKDDDVSIIYSMKRAFEATEKLVLPVFEKIHDLHDVIDYLCIFDPSFIKFGLPENGFTCSAVTDGLICFKLEDPYEGIKKRLKSTQNRFKRLSEKNVEGFTEEKCKELLQKLDSSYIKWKIPIDETLSNKKYTDMAMLELERRKERNLSVLKSYGL